MKRDVPTQVGIGFTILVGSATFLVAVLAGVFLIWQPDAGTLTQRPAQARQQQGACRWRGDPFR